MNVASMTLMEPVGLIDNSTYSTYTLLNVTITKTKIDLILITLPIFSWLSQSRILRFICYLSLYLYFASCHTGSTRVLETTFTLEHSVSGL